MRAMVTDEKMRGAHSRRDRIATAVVIVGVLGIVAVILVAIDAFIKG